MLLEWLRRRDPKMSTRAAGAPVHHRLDRRPGAGRARAAAASAGARGRRRRLARHRQPEGRRRAYEQPATRARAHLERGLAGDRRRGHPRPQAASWPAASWSTSTGRSARPPRRSTPAASRPLEQRTGRRASRRTRRQVLPLVELRTYLRAVARGARRGRARRQGPRAAAAGRGGDAHRAGRGHRHLPRLSRPAASRASTRPRRTRAGALRRLRGTTRAASPRRRGCCAWPASTGPTPSPSARAATPASCRRPATAAIRCSNVVRKLVDGPLVWAPGGQRRHRRSACAAATSS